MLVDSFLIRFRQFYFLTESDDFANAIALAWRPLLPIFKMLSFLEYEVLLGSFLIGFRHRISILFFDPK